MSHVAFSTVACPNWSLATIAQRAREWDFDGVELRTFGPGGTEIASDPCLSDPAKVRRTLSDHGIALTGYASSARFDEQLTPPIPVGYIFGDFERPVREFKPITEHASNAGAPYARVFGFERINDEPRKRTIKRIADRLKLVCDDARHQRVRIALENAGSFSRAQDLMEIIDRVNSPQLAVCYSISAAHAAGDDPATDFKLFDDDLVSVRLSDHRAGTPCTIGTGDVPCEPIVRALSASRQSVPLVIDWPAMWRNDIESPEKALPASFTAVTSWTHSAQPVGV